RITSTGASTSAICSGELMTTENAYSERFFAASWIPTTFSTALPAIATITKPANASEMCIAPIAGSSACTNHSDTNAAAMADAASSASASGNGQRGGSCCSAASPAGLLLSEAGRVTANNASRITATTSDIASSWGAAGVHVARERWNHHRGDRQQHQHRGGTCALRVDVLRAMPQTTDGK